MVPLAPSVTLHVDWPAQATLQDDPQLPLQVVLFVQAKEQFGEVPQLLFVRLQVAPLGQLQLEPVQTIGSPEPQPAIESSATSVRILRRTPRASRAVPSIAEEALHRHAQPLASRRLVRGAVWS